MSICEKCELTTSLYAGRISLEVCVWVMLFVNQIGWDPCNLLGYTIGLQG